MGIKNLAQHYNPFLIDQIGMLISLSYLCCPRYAFTTNKESLAEAKIQSNLSVLQQIFRSFSYFTMRKYFQDYKICHYTQSLENTETDK
ncbi:hypothetical protein SK128_002636, partial [Halocaridina rubra]